MPYTDEEFQDDPEIQPDTDTDEAIEIVDDEAEEDLSYYGKQEKENEPEVESKESQESREKKKIGNPYAALRIATRENSILSDRLNRVLSILEQNQIQQQPQPEQEETEEVDYSFDPIGAVNAKVDKILTQTEKEKKEREQRERAEQIERVTYEANHQIETFREKIGKEEYDAAIQHLVRLRVSDLQEAYPNATQEEIGQVIMQEAMTEKMRLHSLGKNPGEVFYGYATRHGWTKGARKQEQQKQRVDPRESIARSKEREQKSKTIAAATGKPARTLSPDDFIGMSEDDFDSYVSQLAKSKGKRGGSLKISEILNSTR